MRSTHLPACPCLKATIRAESCGQQSTDEGSSDVASAIGQMGDPEERDLIPLVLSFLIHNGS